jgi:hypothetical protein
MERGKQAAAFEGFSKSKMHGVRHPFENDYLVGKIGCLLAAFATADNK